MATGTEDIFAKALKSINPGSKTPTNPPKSLEDLRHRIAEIDKKFNENSRNTKVWTNLDRILALFETTGNIINAAVSSTVAPASLIMSSFLHLISTVRGSVAAYQSIGDFFGRVAGTLDRMTIHDGTIIDPILGEILAKTVILVSEILVLASSYLGKRRKRDIGKEFLVRLFFGACSELEAKMTALQDLAQEEAMACISLIKRDTSMLHDELQEMSTAVQRIDRNIESQRFETKLDLRTWHEIENIHDAIQKERRAAVKAKWIVDEPLVKKWLRGETARVIWIHGEPGIGKSFATSRLITEIANQRKIRAYFYVRENDSATSIFKCLALQLAVRSRGFNAHAIKALEVLDSVRNEEKIWEHFFVPFLSKERPWRTYVVIDGLDAVHPSEQRKVVDILSLFNRRTYAGKTTFHIAVITRSDLHLMSDICNAGSRLQASSKNTKSDIAEYIRNRFSDKRRFKDLGPADREYAMQKLTKEANGMFLWVSLVIAQAEEMGSRTDIMNFLETGYPKDHTNHLGRILDGAAEKVHDPARFQTFLRWVACARRPLTASELQSLPLGGHQTSSTFSRESLERNFKHLIALTASCDSTDAADMTVHFKHRCFKDHLLCNPMLTASRPHSFTRSAAHASIFRACLSLLLDSFNDPSGSGAPSLVQYAADHVIEHFIETDIETEVFGYEVKQQLGDLVQDPVTIQGWYDSMSDRYRMTLFPALLETPRRYQRIIYWVTGQKSSPKEFFKTLAAFCAEGWLRSGAVNLRTAVAFLDRYNHLDDASKAQVQAAVDDCGNPDISNLSSNRIIELADLQKLDQTANWHVRLASALRKANHIQESINQYRSAEQKDPSNWLIQSGLSMACAAAGQYDKAVRKAQKALKCVPRPTGACRSNIYFNISIWNGIRGKTEAQIEAAQKAYSSQADSLPMIANYMAVLGRSMRFAELLEVCRSLHKKNRGTSAEGRLVEVLSGWEEGLEIFGRAAVESGHKEDIAFAEEVFKSLVRDANSRPDRGAAVFAQYQLGLFYLQYQRDHRQARKAWRKLKDTAENDPEAQIYAHQLQCRGLAKLYLTRALIAQRSAKDKKGITNHENPDITSLRDLASAKIGSSTGLDYSAEARALLGYWERKHGSKTRTKDHFRANVSRGIQILEDEDPLNDIDGYVILGNALLIAGYIDDAKRAFATAMLFSESSPGPGSKPRLLFQCHGKPDCQEDDPERLYICQVCPATIFCERCWKTFKDRKSNGNEIENEPSPAYPYTTCHPSHLFSNIYHKEHKLAEPIAVMEDGQLKPDAAWLDAVKRKWDIAEDTPSAVSLPIPRVVMQSRRLLRLVE
ncbi:hypothetical protein BJX70DRAFT_397597 [Aspergillus crustosus]